MTSCLLGIPRKEHLRLLGDVLDHMERAGLRARKDKYLFMVPEVSYLGHRIDANGLHPLEDKVKAILEAPSP